MNLHSHIVEGIKTLLHEQDYVVIPDFGGFVTQVHFSKYLVEKNILTPPGKVISFNKQLRQNDGALVFWLQNKLSVNSEIALKHLNEFSEYCTEVLRNKRRLSLENLGFFYLDIENNICFEPKNDSNYLLDSFGLTPVILNELPVVAETEKEIKLIDRGPEESKQELPIKRKRNFKPLAYVLMGGSILFFSLAALVTINKTQGPLLSGIFNNSVNKTYKPITYSDLVLEKTNSEPNAYIPNSEGVAVIELNKKSIAVTVNENPDATSVSLKASFSNKTYSGKFQIVLGCFSLKNNAEKMVRKLKKKNVNAGISGINSRGMHVVSCAGFNSKDDAQNYLSEIKTSFPTAWIKSDN